MFQVEYPGDEAGRARFRDEFTGIKLTCQFSGVGAWRVAVVFVDVGDVHTGFVFSRAPFGGYPDELLFTKYVRRRLRPDECVRVVDRFLERFGDANAAYVSRRRHAKWHKYDVPPNPFISPSREVNN